MRRRSHCCFGAGGKQHVVRARYFAPLAGEPGIGKSRVTQVIVDSLRDRPHTQLRLSCSPHRQDSALFPIISYIERTADFQRGDNDEQRLIKLERVLSCASKVCSDAVPLVADLLSVPIINRYPPPPALTPQQRKDKTLVAVLAYIEGLAASRPLLLVIEDVHWSDPTTLELIDLIVERAPQAAASRHRYLSAGIRLTMDGTRPNEHDDIRSTNGTAQRGNRR